MFVRTSEHIFTSKTHCQMCFWLRWDPVEELVCRGPQAHNYVLCLFQQTTCSSREGIGSWICSHFTNSAFCFDWINKRVTCRCGQRKIIERQSSQVPHLRRPCHFNDRVAACDACKIIQLTAIYTHISKFTRNVGSLRQYVQKIVTCRLLFGRLKQTKEFCFF